MALQPLVRNKSWVPGVTRCHTETETWSKFCHQSDPPLRAASASRRGRLRTPRSRETSDLWQAKRAKQAIAQDRTSATSEQNSRRHHNKQLLPLGRSAHARCPARRRRRERGSFALGPGLGGLEKPRVLGCASTGRWQISEWKKRLMSKPRHCQTGLAVTAREDPAKPLKSIRLQMKSGLAQVGTLPNLASDALKQSIQLIPGHYKQMVLPGEGHGGSCRRQRRGLVNLRCVQGESAKRGGALQHALSNSLKATLPSPNDKAIRSPKQQRGE